MTRRVVTAREHARAQELRVALADECKRLSEAVQAGQVVTLDIHGQKCWLLGAGTCDEGRRPALVLHPVNAAGVIAPASGFTVKGEIDGTWADVLKSAGVARNPALDPEARIIVPGR